MIDLFTVHIPFIAVWFARITGIPQRIKLLSRKPFDCPKCLAFWMSLFYQIHIGFTIYSVSIIVFCSIAAYLLEYYSEKIKLPLN